METVLYRGFYFFLHHYPDQQEMKASENSYIPEPPQNTVNLNRFRTFFPTAVFLLNSDPLTPPHLYMYCSCYYTLFILTTQALLVRYL